MWRWEERDASWRCRLYVGDTWCVCVCVCVCDDFLLWEQCCTVAVEIKGAFVSNGRTHAGPFGHPSGSLAGLANLLTILVAEFASKKVRIGAELDKMRAPTQTAAGVPTTVARFALFAAARFGLVHIAFLGALGHLPLHFHARQTMLPVHFLIVIVVAGWLSTGRRLCLLFGDVRRGQFRGSGQDCFRLKREGQVVFKVVVFENGCRCCCRRRRQGLLLLLLWYVVLVVKAGHVIPIDFAFFFRIAFVFFVVAGR